MQLRTLNISVPALLCLMVVGCGGSSNGGGGGGGGGTQNPTSVTVTFSGESPTAVATQIGTGAFTPVTVATSTSSVTLSVPYGTKNFAVAWVCPAVQLSPSDTTTYQYVAEVTTTDATSYGFTCPLTSLPTVQTGTLTLSVDASAFALRTDETWNYLTANAGNSTGFEFGSPDMTASNFSFAAPLGSDRVDLIVSNVDVVPGTAYVSLVAMKSFSDVAVPGVLNGGDTVTFTSADAAINEPITYKNLQSGYTQPNYNEWIYPSGDTRVAATSQGTAAAYQGLPATIAQSGDEYIVQASSAGDNVQGGPSGAIDVVTAQSSFQGEGPLTLTFPAPWTYGGPTPAALPSMNLAYSGFSGQSDIVENASLTWYPPTSYKTSYSDWVGASGNYLNGSQTLTFPDLSSLQGFNPNPVSGAGVTWEANIFQGTPGLGQSNPTLGTLLNVSAVGVYTVP